MKRVFIISLCLSALTAKLNAQFAEVKYRIVLDYFKRQRGASSLNISPVIKYIGIDRFSTARMRDSVHNYVADSCFTGTRKKLYFDPFIDSAIIHCPENKSVKDEYVIFSKPVSNFLIIEIRSGSVPRIGSQTPYFGTGTDYLFIFDKDDKIVKVFTASTIYN